MLKAPAFLFPTSVILIDDDYLYAQLLPDRLKNCPPMTAFSNFDFLLEQQENDFLLTNYDKNNIHKDHIYQNIKQSINNKTNQIKGVISVIVCDFHLQNTTGLELFNKLKSPFIYKILISNFIDPESESEDEIKNAQNAGIIDVVLEKGTKLREQLPNAIFTGQSKFFTLLSNQIFEKQETQNHLSDTILSNHFIKMIDQFRPEYIWPEIDLASFTLEKANSKQKKRVFITTTDEINTLLSGYNAETALATTIEKLKSGDFIICHENPHSLDGLEWAYHLRPASKIAGSNSNFLYHTIEECE